MKKAVLLAALLLMAAPAGRTAEGPGLLMVPLLAASSPEGWYGPTLDRILEEKVRALAVFDVAAGEKKDEALRFLAGADKIDPAVLSAAVELADADFAIVGQFSADGGRLVMDLRIFSPAKMEQTASFQLEGPMEEVFAVMTEGALFVVDRFGIAVSDEMKSAVAENSTTSLEAYRVFHEARSKSETSEQVELLLEAVRLDPGYIDANVRLGLALHRLGRSEEAVGYLERAAELRPDVPETFNNLAVIYAQMERRKDALAAFEKALELKPDYPEARLNYGRLLEESNRYDQAEGVYLDLLEEDPDNVKARSSLALLYERTGRTELAVQEFRVLSRTSPDLAEEFFLSRGKEARKAREYQKAERFFKRAVDINPQFAQGYAELGTNSFLAGNFDESKKYFLQALALEPQRGEFHHYLGLAQEKQGLRGDARQSFLRSIEVGGPLGSHLQLARIYLAEGESAKAADELNLVLAIDSGHAEARDLLARAMARSEADQKKDQERAAFATRRLDRLESIIEGLTDDNRELENRFLALQAERQEAERELVRLREEKARREVDFGERMEEALRSIEELSAGDEMEKIRGQYLQQVGNLEEELSTSRRALAEAEEMLVEAEQMRMPDNEEIGEELAKERKQAAVFEKALRDAKQDGERAAAEVDIMTAEIQRWKEREAAWAAERKEFEKRLAGLGDEKAEEGKQLSRLQERNRGLEERAKTFDRDMDDARRETRELKKEADSLQGKYNNLVGDSAGLEQELARARGEAEDLRRRMDEEKRGLAERYDGQEKALQAAQKREEKLVADRERLEKEKTRLNNRLDEETAGLKKELAAARAAVDDLGRRADAEQGELADRYDEKEKESRAAREREQELLGQRERLEQENTGLKSSLAVADRELEGLRAALTASSREEERLREAEKALLVERGRLEKEKSELEGRLAAEGGSRERAVQAERKARAGFDDLRGQILELALELGTLQMQERSWEKAAKAYERVLAIDPSMAEAYYRLGEIYFQVGRFDDSKKMYQKAGESY